MIYLISYPRSGNTMTRYIFELLTKKPSNGLCGKPNPKDILQKPLIHEGDDYCLHKRHDFRGVKAEDFVFFLVRDPLEACIRHNEKARGLSEEKMKGYLDSWFELIKQYDEFKGGKMLLYYEEVQKIASQVSRSIYPDSQSDHPDYHKHKLGKEVLENLYLFCDDKYIDMIEKYLNHYFI